VAGVKLENVNVSQDAEATALGAGLQTVAAIADAVERVKSIIGFFIRSNDTYLHLFPPIGLLPLCSVKLSSNLKNERIRKDNRTTTIHNSKEVFPIHPAILTRVKMRVFLEIILPSKKI